VGFRIDCRATKDQDSRPAIRTLHGDRATANANEFRRQMVALASVAAPPAGELIAPDGLLGDFPDGVTAFRLLWPDSRRQIYSVGKELRWKRIDLSHSVTA
jgi:hypothetical protein